MRKHFALALCAAFVSACNAVEPDARTLGSRSDPIVGGSVEAGWAAVGAFVVGDPSLASFASFCTGTLVAPRWVLTAAHCVVGPDAAPADQLAFSSATGRRKAPGTTTTSPP